MDNNILYDVNIIRDRWNPDDNWRYEICSDKELENYENAKDAYQHCVDRGDGEYQKLNAGQLEVIFSGNLYISKELSDILA